MKKSTQNILLSHSGGETNIIKLYEWIWCEYRSHHMFHIKVYPQYTIINTAKAHLFFIFLYLSSMYHCVIAEFVKFRHK